MKINKTSTAQNRDLTAKNTHQESQMSEQRHITVSSKVTLARINKITEEEDQKEIRTRAGRIVNLRTILGSRVIAKSSQR